jgi:hypothetical protein
MAVARDGTGGLVYLKDVAGVPHVFVSQLLGGVFSAPIEVDGALPSPSSQPVIAGSPGGILMVAFVNGGQLYAVTSAGGPAQFGAPQVLFAGASNPAISATYIGKAYLAFTATVDGVSEVRAAYYWQGSWALEPTPLNNVPTEDAGTGDGAPAVAAAQDGVGIVAFGEAGHIYLRRVWGTAPSVVDYQVDVPSVSGWNEVSAADPSIATGADSSYVNVAFEETLTNGTVQQTRSLLHLLVASEWLPIAAPDGFTTPGAESAGDADVSMGEYGDGVASAVHQTTDEVWGMTLANDGGPTSAIRIDSLPNASAPDPVSAAAGYYSGLVAWQHDPGALGIPEVRARFYTNHAWEPELVSSSPSLGPTDAAAGLVAGGDLSANVAVAWVQGTGANTVIAAAQLYQPPGAFKAVDPFRYVRSVYPLLSWTPPHENWGPDFQVSVDGVSVKQTDADSSRVGPLAQGPHTWSVVAINGAGLESATKSATVFVDTVPPTVTTTLSGTLEVGKELHVGVQYSDTPPGGTPAEGSGVSLVTVNWGDGSKFVITHGKYHAYKKPGHYLLTVTVSDRAGNKTTKTQELVIKPKPKPKRKHRKHKQHGGRR